MPHGWFALEPKDFADHLRRRGRAPASLFSELPPETLSGLPNGNQVSFRLGNAEATATVNESDPLTLSFAGKRAIFKRREWEAGGIGGVEVEYLVTV